MTPIPLPKMCCTCKQKKNSFEFSLNKNHVDGREPRCKSCVAEVHRKRMNQDPDRMNRKYRENQNDFSKIMEVPPQVIEKLKIRLNTESKICRICQNCLPLSSFYVRIRSGKHINIRPNCKKCHNLETVESAHSRPANSTLSRYKSSALQKGLQFDLDLDFVKESLSQSCFYCGETQILRTIDRSNSSIGYIRSNCVPCCIRCNLVKSDMPLAAWDVVSHGMRRAREAGLLGNWIGRRKFSTKKNITR